MKRRKWTDAEIEKLIRLHNSGVSQGKISIFLKRKQNSVHSKKQELIRLGLMPLRTREQRHRIHQIALIEYHARRRGESLPVCSP